MSSSKREEMKKLFVDTIASTLNDEQKKKFNDIIDNKDLTKQQMRDQIKSFCESCGDATAAKFQEVHGKFEAKKAEYAAKIKENEGKLSAETKALLAQAKTIHEDLTITHAQEHEKMQALLGGAPASAKDELKALGEPFTDLLK
uniref:SXP/RAL-2 family protein Ani s 5-like cation-binding domain-containing protein n=1 Tax=Panagrolaimus superbus TaxID=310955 RepID=A0A914YIU9_9BILA